ncbi:MAG: alpha/beta hydrolase [Anaerolineales bacterium]|nr:alpha/beta hydrolase [Anaerolineales bacterium]
MEIIQTDQIQIAFERMGRGSPLVLIHGYPLDHSIWNETARLLADEFEIILPDVRGFGGSSTVDAAYSMADLADDLAALLDALKIEQAFVAGHSMGGYIALAFAKKYPGRVRGLALVASQALADTEERKRGRYETVRTVEEKGVSVIVEPTAAGLTKKRGLQNQLRRMIAAQSQRGVVGALGALAEREDTSALFATIKFPVALIHGDDDQLIPLERARAIKRLYPSAHLTELPEVGHMPMLEAPEKTAEALKQLK